jgi:DNA-binding winged helix-turn-helix (wHTH) protein
VIVYRFAASEVRFEFNPSTGQLFRLGKPVDPPLPDQECRLLEYFIHHRNETLSRDQLQQAVWGKRFMAHDTVDKAVSVLRAALSDSAKEQSFIETVRSTKTSRERSYKFVAELTASPNDKSDEENGVLQDRPTHHDTDHPLQSIIFALEHHQTNPEGIHWIGQTLVQCRSLLRRIGVSGNVSTIVESLLDDIDASTRSKEGVFDVFISPRKVADLVDELVRLQNESDGVLRDAEIGFVKEAGFARAEKMENDEEWISAAEASRLITKLIPEKSNAAKIAGTSEATLDTEATAALVNRIDSDICSVTFEGKSINVRGPVDEVKTVTEAVYKLSRDIESQPVDQPSAQARGGRPKADWWEDMWVEIARQLYLGALIPKTQADLERAMLQWISDNGKSAGETTVRDRASKLWRVIKDGN